MVKRFFKLLYVLALIILALSLPIFALTSIKFDKIVQSSYKARCLSNNQYVVLQGSQVGDADVMDEIYLNSSENRTAIKEQLNFYCKYYDEVQPHIVAYNEAISLSEQRAANIAFTEFKNSRGKVYSYPELYSLELVSNEIHPEELYYPLMSWLIGALIAFVLLHAMRICYLYVVFGQVIWHPFKPIKK